MADLTVVMPILMTVGIVFVVLMGLAALFKSFYNKVEQGTALIVNWRRVFHLGRKGANSAGSFAAISRRMRTQAASPSEMLSIRKNSFGA